jgi:2,5-diamino-6-(ribosylamino)-4(3H)-pyrimidinone 5'-phosphate reductase
VEVFADNSPRVDLKKMMEKLKGIGVNRLMVEGGGTINFELLKLELIDELLVYIAPMIFGGEDASTPASGSGLTRDKAIALKLTNVETQTDGGILLNYKLQGTHKT